MIIKKSKNDQIYSQIQFFEEILFVILVLRSIILGNEK
jgi:hypothetical protein